VVLVQEAIGVPSFAQVEVRMRYDPAEGHWFGKDRRWWTLAFTVHHLSLCHLLFGPPETVFAVTGRDPGQHGVSHEGYGHLILTYASGLRVVVLSTGTYYGTRPRPHRCEELWVQGASGIVDWTPQGGLEISRTPIDGQGATRVNVPVARPGVWFPDAFGLAMAHFQQALDAGATPICSVADNLYVMAVIEAAYLSGSRNETVRVPEVMGARWHPDYGPGWSRGFTEWVPPEPA
jgi:predicted dehydrogenase